MFCPKCGVQLQPHARFCERCGAPIRTTGTTQAAPSQSIAMTQPTQTTAAPQPMPQPITYAPMQAQPQYQQQYQQQPIQPAAPEDPTLASTQLKHLWAKMRLFDHVCGMVPTFLKNNPAMIAIALTVVFVGIVFFAANLLPAGLITTIIALLIVYIGTAATDGARMAIWDSMSFNAPADNMTPADEVPGSVAQAAKARKAGLDPDAVAAATAAAATAQAGQIPTTPGQPAPTVIVNNTTEVKGSNGAGTAGLIFALLGALFSWSLIVGIVLWLLGVLFSFIGLFKSPRGAAIAGFILSFIDVIIIIAFVGGIATFMTSIGA